MTARKKNPRKTSAPVPPAAVPPAAVPPADDSPMMTPSQAAAYLGVKTQTLSVWRCKKRHSLRYYRVGRLIKYRRADLDAWLNANATGGSNDAAG